MALSAERQKILDRVAKLLALASGTTFEAEAAAAREMAEGLIQRHGVTTAERDGLTDERYTPWAKGAQWEYIIYDALARLCGCKTYWRGDFEEFVAVGAGADLEAVRFLIGEVGRQRIRAWLDYKRTGTDNLWSFCFAFARALEAKIDAITRDAGELSAARERARLWYESTHNIRMEHLIGGPGASEAGREAGLGASLHRGNVGQPQLRLGRRS